MMREKMKAALAMCMLQMHLGGKIDYGNCTIFQLKCKWECGFKTAPEYNVFPITTSRASKPESEIYTINHRQQTDEDDCAVNSG